MSPRVALVALLAFPVYLPAVAGEPVGLAAKIITNDSVEGFDCGPGVEWYEFLGVRELDPSDTLHLNFAIIPFASGVTSVGLDEGEFATTFVSLAFADGLVNGLPYRRFGWNDVSLVIRPAAQDYLLTVNGAQAGPFRFGGSCAGGCSSVQAFRLNGSFNGGGSVAWIDSVSLLWEDGAPLCGGFCFEDLFLFTADRCETPSRVTGGGLVLAEAPDRIRPGRCRDVLR